MNPCTHVCRISPWNCSVSAVYVYINRKVGKQSGIKVSTSPFKRKYVYFTPAQACTIFHSTVASLSKDCVVGVLATWPLM